MKTNYLFTDENRITATLVSDYYIWITFFGEDNICSLYKSSCFDPNIVYWDVDVTGDEITSLTQDTTYLYGALDDVVNIGAKITQLTPTTITYFIKDVGITEKAIDIIIDTSYVYFLTPGVDSGTNAKIVKYNKSTRAYIETIDLSTVTNAKKIDIDNSGNLWVVSDEDSIPVLTKVWFSGTWQFSSTTLS